MSGSVRVRPLGRKLDNIISLDTVDLITNILNIENIDLIDLITTISTITSITNIVNIESVDLIDEISTITNIVNIEKISKIEDISWSTQNTHKNVFRKTAGAFDWITPTSGKKIRIKFYRVHGVSDIDNFGYFIWKNTTLTFGILKLKAGKMNQACANLIGCNIEGQTNEVLQVGLSYTCAENLTFEVIYDEVD